MFFNISWSVPGADAIEKFGFCHVYSHLKRIIVLWIFQNISISLLSFFFSLSLSLSFVPTFSLSVPIFIYQQGVFRLRLNIIYNNFNRCCVCSCVCVFFVTLVVFFFIILLKHYYLTKATEWRNGCDEVKHIEKCSYSYWQ